MSKIKIKFAALVFYFLTFLFFDCSAFANSRNLTIFAEPNISLALTKIARLYSQRHDVIVSVNFNSSADLINSIDSGEPADIFISAHPDWIETLQQKGLVDVYNTGLVARDSLVLITSKSNRNVPESLNHKNISVEESLQILDQNNATLILDYTGNSSGKFSNDLLKKMNLFSLQVFHKLAEDKSPVFNTLKTDTSYYALLLASQVREHSDYITLSTKDAGTLYRALVIAGDNMDIAREFLKFLKTEPAKKILQQSGFGDI